MSIPKIGIPALLSYSDFLNAQRSKNSVAKKLYTTILYKFTVPLFRLFSPILSLFVRNQKKSTCDILILGTCERDLTGSAHIWDALREKGYSVEQTYIRKKSDFFRFALRNKISPKVPSSLYLQASAARYFVEMYQPKMVVTFYSYDVLPSFLRAEMQGKGPLVYIAHAVIPTTYIYTSFDYDYYLVFGKSSITNILTQSLRIGTTKAICCGSPMIGKDFYLPTADPEQKTLLYFSNWMVGVDQDYTHDFEIVAEWAKTNPDYKLLIKLHPLEHNGYVQNAVKDIKNIDILEASIAIKDAIAMASATIVAFSVASLESALLNRPVLVANFRPIDPTSGDARVSDNFLHLEQYFPPRANNSSALAERINELFSNYPHYVEQCKEFVKLHIESGMDSSICIVQTLDKIYNTDLSLTYINIPEKIQ